MGKRASRTWSSAPYLGLALGSGLVSAVSADWPGGSTVSLPLGFDLKPVWPGIAYGVALSIAFRRLARASCARLAAAFLVVQAAWQAAVSVAILVHGGVVVGSAASWGPVQLDGRMVLPGFMAGAVGAFGTWLAAAVCAAPARFPGVAAAASLTGAVSGLLLAVDNRFLLYVVWQCAVAAMLLKEIAGPRD